LSDGVVHAIRLHAFGPPDHLVLDELPDLSPDPGHVRIAVEASGVHLLDTTLRRGDAGPVPLPELPTVPGREVAGVVDAVGRDADPAWLGQRVVAHLGQVPGGYAEQAVTAAQHLLAVPDRVGFPEAVAAVGTGRTALGVVELEPPSPDDVVLVPSAAGGLGWLLVQSALAAGATVVAAASGERTAVLAGVGAALVVDYTQPGWEEKVRAETGGVTLVYDGVGGDVGRATLELLRPGGRHVMFGFSAGTPTRLTTDDLIGRGITAGWSLGPRMMALPGGIPGLAGRALAKVAAGEWQPLVSTYPLAEAGRAHADLEGRRALGKVVLVRGPEPS
jgi:NADPH2:quinone reductase